jgi:hypothetical protein
MLTILLYRSHSIFLVDLIFSSSLLLLLLLLFDKIVNIYLENLNLVQGSTHGSSFNLILEEGELFY